MKKIDIEYLYELALDENEEEFSKEIDTVLTELNDIAHENKVLTGRLKRIAKAYINLAQKYMQPSEYVENSGVKQANQILSNY